MTPPPPHDASVPPAAGTAAADARRPCEPPPADAAPAGSAAQLQAERRTLWLHIGMLKTGTTTLQEFLFLNRGMLARQGFLYPLCLKEVLPGLHEHNQVVMAAPWQARALREETQRSGCRHAIISAESLQFSRRTPESVRHFVGFLRAAGFEEVRVIVYLRPIRELLASWASQHLRWGATRPFDALPPQQQPFARILCDYRELLSLWEGVCGRAALRVRLLEADSLCGGDLLRDFLAVLGLPWSEELQLPQRRNERLSLIEMELLRALSCTVAGDANRTPLKRRIMAMLHEHLQPLPEAAQLRYAPPAALAEAYERYFAEATEWVRREFFPRRRQLFAPRPQPAGQPHPGALEERHWECLAGMLAELACGGRQCLPGPDAGGATAAAPPALRALRRPQGAAVTVIVSAAAGAAAAEGAEEELRCTLESALRQDLAGTQVIAVHDLPEAAPAARLLCDYAARTPQCLQVIAAAGAGAAAALNAALDRAQGEYVTLAACGERLAEDFCRRLQAAALAAGADLARGELLRVHGGELRASGLNELMRRRCSPLYFFEGPAAALYRRSLLLRHGIGFMPAGTARVQGLLFHSLALLHCRRLVLDDRAEVRAAPPGGGSPGRTLGEEQLRLACSAVQDLCSNLLACQTRLDPEGLAYALLRCVTLLEELAGQAAAGEGERRCRVLAARLEELLPYQCRHAFACMRRDPELP